jgi:NhaA family Na+:H+ antiporter
MRRRIAPLRDFLNRESTSGLLILLASSLGLITANSPLANNYFTTLDFKVSLGVDWYLIDLSILKVINYLLMSIFFFVVGLEIKRELTSGHLTSFKKAILPFVAALGGMAAPALIYLAIAGGVAPGGWGVPVATDIALAVGLLAMLGPSVAASLRSFLLALAVIDDIGAILIIAFVYSTGIKLSWLLAAAVCIGLIAVLKKSDLYIPQQLATMRA